MSSTVRQTSLLIDEVPEAQIQNCPNSLRVLHVGKYYPPHHGGMETHLQLLCGELKRSIGVEVIVANDDRQTLEETIDGINVTRVGTLYNLAAAPVCPEMAKRIREAQADLVHIHLPHPTATLSYLVSGHRGRLVFTYHSDIIRQKVLRKAYWPVLSHALKRADAIIATSPNYMNTSPILQKFRERCRIIPFGITLDQFNSPDSIEVTKIRKKYGPRLILTVGRLVYYKGFKYLIRAMKGVKGHLLIVGDGPLRDALEQEARDCGVSARVSILTEVGDVTPYYHACDVFTLPAIARSEAFGIVQLEAMACGKPIVNTALDSGVPFVSPHRVSGLTVPPADAQALGRAINALLDDPARSAEYGRAGRRRVEQVFSLEVMACRTLRLYREVLYSTA